MSASGSLLRARRAQERTRLIVLAAVLAAAFVLSLCVGDSFIDPVRVIEALFSTDGGVRMVVVGWRMPRALAAVVFGAALALSGTVFQTITRNQLGSPDVIGLTTGAYTGALIVMTGGLAGSGLLVTVGAVVGGFATAALVAALVVGRGAIGYRIVIVGIGVGAVLAAVNAWMLLRARLEVAISAAIWGAGTLGGITWQQIGVPLIVIGALLAVLIPARRGLWLVELGDELGAGLGGRMTGTKIGLVAIAVGLTAVVTAIAGPISFVALAAPHLARSIVRSGSGHLVATALMGGMLLCASDLIAQNGIPGHALPVGVVTLVLGGVYLIWLIVRGVRRSG